MAIALDIGPKNLRIIYTRGNRVEKWVTALLPAGMVADGNILQPEAVGKIISGAIKNAGIPEESVSVTLTGLSYTYRMVSLPRLKSSQMDEAVLRAARKEIPVPLEEMYVTWQATGETKDEASYFLAGMRRDLLNALVKTMASAGLKLAAFDLKPLALARAVNRRQALVVNFAPDCFDIVLVADGLPAILHSFTPRAESVDLEDNIARLADELSRTVDFYNITHAAQPIGNETPLIIAGELAGDPGVIARLRDTAGFAAEPFQPSVEYAAGFPALHYAANIGLVLKSKRVFALPRGDKNTFSDINIDFIASKHRLEKPGIAAGEKILQGAFLTAVALLIALSLLRAGVNAENKRLGGENDALARELNLARARADQAAITEAAIIELKAETASLQNQQLFILGKDSNHAAMLQTIVDTLPVGVAFTGIEFTADDISINGTAGTRASIIDYATLLGQKSVFTDVRIARVEAEGDTFGYRIVLTH